MKFLLAVVMSSLFFPVFASTPQKVSCFSEKNTLSVAAELNFEMIKNGNKSVLTNIVGHVFVRSPYGESAEFSTENSYMGFFKIDKLSANPNYNPRKYVGYAQFLNLDAIHTTGLESGMFGYLAIDVSGHKNDLKAAYVFQAGDHMGGTVFLNCKAF